MKNLSERILNIAPSLTVAVDTLAKKLKAEGKDIVSLGAGEPDWDTPIDVRNAGKASIDQGKTRYSAPQGILEVREAVCEKLGILKNALESVCGTADQAPVVDALKKVVPTYRDPETVNNSAAAERELASHCGANNEPTEENAG